MARSNEFYFYDYNKRIRKLTPSECCKLQTIDYNYFLKNNKQVISDNQLYACIGNAWTVDVITHILSYIKLDYDINIQQ